MAVIRFIEDLIPVCLGILNPSITSLNLNVDELGLFNAKEPCMDCTNKGMLVCSDCRHCPLPKQADLESYRFEVTHACGHDSLHYFCLNTVGEDMAQAREELCPSCQREMEDQQVEEYEKAEDLKMSVRDIENALFGTPNTGSHCRSCAYHQSTGGMDCSTEEPDGSCTSFKQFTSDMNV